MIKFRTFEFLFEIKDPKLALYREEMQINKLQNMESERGGQFTLAVL